MTLMLHAGVDQVEYPALRDLPIPAATATQVPIPHYRVVDLIKSTLGMYLHVVEEEHYGVTLDGMRFFGALSPIRNYTAFVRSRTQIFAPKNGQRTNQWVSLVSRSASRD